MLAKRPMTAFLLVSFNGGKVGLTFDHVRVPFDGISEKSTDHTVFFGSF